MTQARWPAPDAAKLAHNQQLIDIIAAKIDDAAGAISFADYMQYALYTPQLGYYNSPAMAFGTLGDFTTAPEISPMFGFAIAQFCAASMQSLQAPNILEFGAGSGQLAVAILQSLAKLDCLPDNYFILELSASLKQQQQRTIETQIPQLAARVQWLTTLPTTPINGIILANEVLDAMPVQRFRISESAIEAVYVAYEQQQFRECYQVCSDPQLLQLVAKISQQLPRPYISEFNPALVAWINSMYSVINRGVMLLIDYGFPCHEYYHPQRSNGTLMCHYQHHAHSNPYINVGLQDITAHVDFTAVAESAAAIGWQVAGFTNQASFLLANNLLEYAQASSLSQSQQLNVNHAIKMLTLPHEMGELFKVIALTKQFDAPLQGFNLLDLRHRL